MKTKLILLSAIIALSIGCTREIENKSLCIDGEITLYASSEGGATKTVLRQDGSVWWNPSDCINVFYGNASGKFTSKNDEPAASAEFTGSLGSFILDGETDFIAAYPYSEATAMSGNALSINLPAEQVAAEGTFTDELYISVAKSKDVNLHFYNVCGGVKFSLASDGVKKVVFKGNGGESLAGRLNVVFDGKGIPQVSSIDAGSETVSLIAPDGGTFKQGVWYYLVLAPKALTQGYTMEIWADELEETVSSENSVTVRRSAWGVLKELGTSHGSIKAVDLGLTSGLKWATCNVGANAPEEYGDYFAWGGTAPQESYNWSTCPFRTSGNSYGTVKFSKYNTKRNYGPVDNDTVLDPEDDAATVNWGGTWRMPTFEEWKELLDECTWTWTTQNGVSGRLVTSNTNGNSIFLPAAGGRDGTDLNYTGSYGDYLSSSLSTGDPYCAYGLGFGSDGVVRGVSDRFYGQSVRPVTDEGVRVSVTGISLSKQDLYLNVGEVEWLWANVEPWEATQPNVIWSSSDASVASVDYNGQVTAVDAGTAIITAKTHDGGFTATCYVTVSGLAGPTSGTINGYDWIDLGLTSGLKWATCNVGASAPEEYGEYFAWGGVAPQESYNWSTCPFCTGGERGEAQFSKYNTLSDNGPIDNNTVLDPEDDAAHVKCEGNWRIPTEKEWGELLDECTWTWTTQNGVNGYLVTSNTNGNSIFLPAAGFRRDTYLYSAGSLGLYWSSSLYTGSPFVAWYVYFNSDGVSRSGDGRFLGRSVRPVSE